MAGERWLRAATFQQGGALLWRKGLVFTQEDGAFVPLDVQRVTGLKLGILAQSGWERDFAVVSQNCAHVGEGEGNGNAVNVGPMTRFTSCTKSALNSGFAHQSVSMLKNTPTADCSPRGGCKTVAAP